MPAARKIPYTDDVILYGRSIGCVNQSPAALAGELKFKCDHGHDDLDHSEILIVECDGIPLAFYKHRGSPSHFANVCPIDGASAAEVRPLLRTLFPAMSPIFEEYEELW
jgi:hypothetical protein